MIFGINFIELHIQLNACILSVQFDDLSDEYSFLYASRHISVTPEGSLVLFCSESLCTPNLTDLAFMTKDHYY